MGIEVEIEAKILEVVEGVEVGRDIEGKEVVLVI